MAARFAIVLGGGRSSRMGTDKSVLLLQGRTLLERAVAACSECERVVVVAAFASSDPRVIVTLEDPPFGGPVAGIAAGLACLPAAEPDDEVLLLACDLPRVAEVARALDAADTGPDGVCLVDDSGYPQYLAGRYRLTAVIAAIAALGDGARGAAVGRLLRGLDLHRVPAPAITDDVDTPAQARAAGIELD